MIPEVQVVFYNKFDEVTNVIAPGSGPKAGYDMVPNSKGGYVSAKFQKPDISIRDGTIRGFPPAVGDFIFLPTGILKTSDKARQAITHGVALLMAGASVDSWRPAPQMAGSFVRALAIDRGSAGLNPSELPFEWGGTQFAEGMTKPFTESFVAWSSDRVSYRKLHPSIGAFWDAAEKNRFRWPLDPIASLSSRTRAERMSLVHHAYLAELVKEVGTFPPSLLKVLEDRGFKFLHRPSFDDKGAKLIIRPEGSVIEFAKLKMITDGVGLAIDEINGYPSRSAAFSKIIGVDPNATKKEFKDNTDNFQKRYLRRPWVPEQTAGRLWLDTFSSYLSETQPKARMAAQGPAGTYWAQAEKNGWRFVK